MDNARSQRGERQDQDIGRYGAAGEVAGRRRLGTEGREVWMGGVDRGERLLMWVQLAKWFCREDTTRSLVAVKLCLRSR